MTWRSACVLVLLLACGGSSRLVCKQDPRTGLDNCYETNNYGEAVVVGGAAAAVWAGYGCTVNGCEAPYRCNQKTKRCERTSCNATKDCPAAYDCDLSRNVCR